jgi:hypothetical protein
MMRLVRWLFGLAVLASVLWGGLWFVGARAVEMAIDQALADPRSPLAAQERRVAGFPNRFDVTLTAPRLATPGMLWSAPFVQAFVLSYRPHHLILVFPPEQQLALTGSDWRLATGDGRMSVVLAPSRRLELDRAALVMSGLDLSGPAALRVEALRAAIRTDDRGGYQAVIELEGAEPDPARLAALTVDAELPRRFSVLRIEAEVHFDRPLDMDALSGGRLPEPRVTLTGARVAWAGVDMRLSGRLDPAAPGGPEGNVVLSVEGWPELLALADRTGALPPDLRAWIGSTAPALARAGQPDAVDIPLRVEAGQVRLGPVVLFDLAG